MALIPFVRQKAGRTPNKKDAVTGRSCYSAKYALTERLVCGECGTLYRRCVWTRPDEKIAVWRCASRVSYGKKYCHKSPTIHEGPLQEAILAAINSAMSQKDVLISRINNAMRLELLASIPGSTMSISDIDRRLAELNGEFQELFKTSRGDGGYMKYADSFKRIADEMAALKEKKAALLEQQNSDTAADRKIQDAIDILSSGSAEITEWERASSVSWWIR